MRLGLALAALCFGTACLFPTPDSTHLYVCASNADCPGGYYCDSASCTQGSPPAPDAGACAAPSCTASGAISLCDGGIVSCTAGQSCDLGGCFPICDGGCSSGMICDQAAAACVPNSACSPGGCESNESCETGICAATPPASPIDAGCSPSPGSGGSIDVSVAVFPGDSVTTVSLAGATVTLFFDGGPDTGVSGVLQAGSSDYQFSNIPSGPVEAVITGTGLVPTYFPNLEITSSATTLNLDTVVSTAYLDSLTAATGYSALPGQILWVGQASSCNDGGYLGGYTVGLSPAPAFVGYYDMGPPGPILSSSSSSLPAYGEFVAVAAPYAATNFVMATSGSPLLKGTFIPPAYDGGIAVALIYPNFSE